MVIYCSMLYGHQNALQERMKELNCLYKISTFVEQKDAQLSDILRNTANTITTSWQYPEITGTVIRLDNESYSSNLPNQPENYCAQQKADIKVFNEVVGSVAVNYYEEKAEAAEGPFLQEERLLIEAIAERIGRIIERKRNEKNLTKAQNYISNIINSMPSVLIGVNREGLVTQWNLQAEQSTGISSADAQGKMLTDIFPQMALDMNIISESINTRKTKQEQAIIRTTEKGNKYEDITIYPLVANGVEGAVIRIDDVTQKVQIKEMMIQSEKMLSVGGLAAGMAHEINNPLAGMMQTASVLASRLADDLPANHAAAQDAGTTMSVIKSFMEARNIPRMLKRINKSGSRAAMIVTNMLSFARKSDSSDTSYDLAELLDKTIELASSDYNLKNKYDFRNFKIIREYEDKLPKIPCVSSKLQQVLLNLLRNGAESMHAAQDVESPKQFILRLASEPEENMVRIEIEDNGLGMTEETSRRIFEPFFTTKSTDAGTGLGLSVSYFIITENHGGTISVKSELGIGTIFIIRLPITLSDTKDESKN